MKNQRGFSLIEILIVLAIFSLAALMSVNVFLAASRSQREAQSQQRVQSDARFTLETLAREIRGGIPDYKLYANPAEDGTVAAINLDLPTHVLAVCDAENRTCRPDVARTIVRQVSADPASNPWAGGGSRLEICSAQCQLPGSWSDITPSGVHLTRFEVFLSPREDPYTLSNTCSQDAALSCTDDVDCNIGNPIPPNRCLQYRGDAQPSVTMILALQEERHPGVVTGPEQIYQTTVTSRFFLR